MTSPEFEDPTNPIGHWAFLIQAENWAWTSAQCVAFRDRLRVSLPADCFARILFGFSVRDHLTLPGIFIIESTSNGIDAIARIETVATALLGEFWPAEQVAEPGMWLLEEHPMSQDDLDLHDEIATRLGSTWPWGE